MTGKDCYFNLLAAQFAGGSVALAAPLKKRMIV
jgi:hypothetical protein